MRRVNGCQCPWNTGQGAAFAIWFVIVAGCYALFIPNITETAAQAAAAVLFSATALGVFCTYIVVCATDPGTQVSTLLEADKPLYCDSCQGYVLRGCKHCKECHKCVEDFDHHCKWINNCIGRKNYRPFFVMLTSICSMLAVQLACGVYLIVRCFTQPAAQVAKLAAVYPTYVDHKAYTAALFMYVTVAVVSLWPLADLLMLHVVLCFRGISTWDYIMANRDSMGEPSALSRSVTKVVDKIKSLGPRSIRVHDSSRIGYSGAGSRKAKVGINPCLACSTDIEKVRTRQENFDYFFTTKNGNKGEQGFDAALLYTPRVPDADTKVRTTLYSQGGVQVYVDSQAGSPRSLAGPSSAAATPRAAAALAAAAAADEPAHAVEAADKTAASSVPRTPRGVVRFSVQGDQR